MNKFHFSSFYIIKIIIKSANYYIIRNQLLSLIKLFIFSILLVTNLCINHICLLFDSLFFNFKNIKIIKPLFVLGFPRSGTTFLHRILLLDKGFTTPKLWELIFAPSIVQKYIYFGIAKFFNKIKFVNKINLLFRPLTSPLDNIHEINLNNEEEDYLLLIPYGACFLLTIVFPIKEIWKLYNFDQNFRENHRIKLLNNYKSLIKRHLYYHGEEKYYLSKNPHFTSFSNTLKIIFPNCNIIGCHRDPKKSLPSLLTSMEPGYLLMSRQIKKDLKQYVNMYQVYFNSLKEENINNNNFLLINMLEIKNNLESSILNIYNQFKYRGENKFWEKIKLESDNSKIFKSQNKYSLEYFSLETIEFEKQYKEYYKYVNEL